MAQVSTSARGKAIRRTRKRGLLLSGLGWDVRRSVGSGGQAVALHALIKSTIWLQRYGFKMKCSLSVSARERSA